MKFLLLTIGFLPGVVVAQTTIGDWQLRPDRPALQDARVRKALALAYDEATIQYLFKRHGRGLNKTEHRERVKRAWDVLNTTNLVRINGVLHRPVVGAGYVPLELSFLVLSSQRPAAEFYAADLARIGIPTRIESAEGQAFCVRAQHENFDLVSIAPDCAD